jgi:peroxiredoxin
MQTTTALLRSLVLASTAIVVTGCRPEVDEPPQEIKNPDKNIGPAKKKADQEAKKDADKVTANADIAKKAEARKKEKQEAAAAKLAPGDAAPDFTLSDLEGKEVKLSSLAGKTVVLEWFNPECPFVVYAHGEEGPLRDMAKGYADKELVWLAINSGAEGKQGAGVEKSKEGVAKYAMEHPVLLDPDGKVGKLYGARTTPQMFVIKPDGTIGYMGGLDNAPRGEARGAEIEPYAKNAIDAVLAGKAPARNESQPYGCSVKYGS